jgi:hypothetical protein
MSDGAVAHPDGGGGGGGAVVAAATVMLAVPVLMAAMVAWLNVRVQVPAAGVATETGRLVAPPSGNVSEEGETVQILGVLLATTTVAARVLPPLRVTVAVPPTPTVIVKGALIESVPGPVPPAAVHVTWTLPVGSTLMPL